MATMTEGFCTIFGSVGDATVGANIIRNQAQERQLWDDTNFTLTTDAARNNERVALMQTSAGVYREFTDSDGGSVSRTYAACGMEIKRRQSAFATHFYFQSAGATEYSLVLSHTDGHMEWWRGPETTLIATDTSVRLADPDTYHTLEMAVGGTATRVFEVRVSGQRVPGLTSSTFGLGQGQPAGTMAVETGAVFTMSRIRLNVGFFGTDYYYYYWQKHGNTLWTSLPLGVTAYLDISDFFGIKKKFFKTPSVRSTLNDFGPTSGGNPAARWSAVGGANDADVTVVADVGATGYDLTDYIKNTTDAGGAPGTNDRAGWTYSALPASPVPVTVAIVQRTSWANAEAGSPGVSIKSGMRQPATSNLFPAQTNAATLNQSTYSTGTSRKLSVPYLKLPYTTDRLTPTNVNAMEGYVELFDIL